MSQNDEYHVVLEHPIKWKRHGKSSKIKDFLDASPSSSEAKNASGEEGSSACRP
jgi:hypothetical protein